MMILMEVKVKPAYRQADVKSKRGLTFDVSHFTIKDVFKVNNLIERSYFLFYILLSFWRMRQTEICLQADVKIEMRSDLSHFEFGN